jgi:hypothetical protein
VVAGSGRQFLSQGIGPRHGQARTVTEQRHARRGIADQCNPAPPPLRQAHLADGVEVEIVGPAHPVQQLRHAPVALGERRKQQLPVLFEIAMVEVRHRWAPEEKGCQRTIASRVE